MIVRHRKTGKEYQITNEVLEKLKSAGKADAYEFITKTAPETPKEVKNVVKPKKEKINESDNNDIQRINDGLPSEDAW